jgi:hypothetical protein
MQLRTRFFITLVAIAALGKGSPLIAREYQIRITDARARLMVVVDDETRGVELAKEILEPNYRSPAFDYGGADSGTLRPGDVLEINHPDDLIDAERQRIDAGGARLSYLLHRDTRLLLEAVKRLQAQSRRNDTSPELRVVPVEVLSGVLRTLRFGAVAIVIAQFVVGGVLWRRMTAFRAPEGRKSHNASSASALVAASADVRTLIDEVRQSNVKARIRYASVARFLQQRRRWRDAPLDSDTPSPSETLGEIEDSGTPETVSGVREAAAGRADAELSEPAHPVMERLLLEAWVVTAAEDVETPLGARYAGRFLHRAGIDASSYVRDGLTFRARSSEASVPSFLFLESERFIAIHSDLSPEYLVYPAQRELSEMQDYVGVFSKLFRCPAETIRGSIHSVVSAARLPAEVVRREVKGPHNSIAAIGNQYFTRGEVELE